MALNNNVGATIQAVFSDPGLYNQIAQKSYLPEAVSTLWNAGNALKEQSLRGQIAEELSKPSPNMNTVMELDAARPNNADPTSTFRWKQSLDQQKAFKDADLERIKAEKEATKELAKKQALNKVTNTLGTINIGLNTTPEQLQQYRNTLAGLMTEAQNAELEDLSPIIKMQERLNDPLPYEVMADLKNKMDLYNKNFESVVGEGTYGSNKDYDTYVKNLDDVWYQSTPEMRRDRDFRLAYDTAKAARAPKKKNPPKFRRK